jgi:hypothetical protein
MIVTAEPLLPDTVAERLVVLTSTGEGLEKQKDIATAVFPTYLRRPDTGTAAQPRPVRRARGRDRSDRYQRSLSGLPRAGAGPTHRQSSRWHGRAKPLQAFGQGRTHCPVPLAQATVVLAVEANNGRPARRQQL